MPFTKDQQKTGGREAGTPNKVNADQREFIKLLLESQQDKIISELEKLEGRDYFTVILSLQNYTLPKLKTVQYNPNTNGSNPFSFSFLTVNEAKELYKELDDKY